MIRQTVPYWNNAVSKIIFPEVIMVGQKSKLLILSEYVNKTEKIWGMWTNKNSYRENEVLSDIFAWIILRHNCLCLNILRLKAINEITPRQTRTSLCKRDVIKVCIEYLTTQIALVLPTSFQLLDRSQNYRIFNVTGYCLAFEISITVQQLTFLTRPACYHLVVYNQRSAYRSCATIERCQ